MLARIIVITLATFVASLSFAQQPAQSLSQCLADSTSGRDRKDLARWVFLAMSVHPEIRQFTAASAAVAAEQSHRTAGALFTRLLTESCSSEVVAAYKQGGSQALEAAFQTLGQLAMKELMSDTGVAASMGAIEKHVDQAKLTRVLQGN